ncbi:outer membrane protein assembly factor BamD, partial [Candidatus Omnitrophota bacterium]
MRRILPTKRIIKIIFFLAILTIAADVLAAAEDRNEFNAAVGYLKKGMQEFALCKFQHIIEIFPSSKYADEAQFMVGEIYYKQGAFWNAEKELAKHARLYPKSKFKKKTAGYLDKLAGKNLVSEAKGYYDNEEWDKALDAYAQAMKLNPELSSVEEKIQRCHKMIDLEQSQAAKGLVKYDGEWMTPEEKSKLEFTKEGFKTAKKEALASKTKNKFARRTLQDYKVVFCVSAQSGQKNFEQVDKAIVAIQTENGHGSGFVINSDGYAITSYHVIAGFDSFTAYLT